MKKSLLITSFLFFLIPRSAFAHCPLCTAGAAIAAGGALWLGVKASVIGLFIGAFAVSLGWWIGKKIKKQYIPLQKTLIIVLSFLTTILPLVPLISPVTPFYLDLGGSYGSLFNRTYVINLFLFGSIVGGAIVCMIPALSQRITKWRNGKMIPFQGITLTFTLLILVTFLLQGW